MASKELTDDYDLQELSESDFEIVPSQPQIFGWDVKDTHRNKVGEVYELLFNPNTCKVRYIVVDMESNDVHLEEGRVLVPIEIADFDLEHDVVKLPGVSITNLLALPLYEHGRLIDKQTDEEISIALDKAEENAPIPPGTQHTTLTKFYSNNDDNFIAGDDNAS